MEPSGLNSPGSPDPKVKTDFLKGVAWSQCPEPTILVQPGYQPVTLDESSPLLVLCKVHGMDLMGGLLPPPS